MLFCTWCSFSDNGPLYDLCLCAGGSQSSHRACQAKECFVVELSRICKTEEGMGKRTNGQKVLPGWRCSSCSSESVCHPVALWSASWLPEINDALFIIHALWHSPQITYIWIFQSMAHRHLRPNRLGRCSKLLTPGPHSPGAASEFLGRGWGSCASNTTPCNSMVWRSLRGIVLCEHYHHITKHLLSNSYVSCIFSFLSMKTIGKKPVTYFHLFCRVVWCILVLSASMCLTITIVFVKNCTDTYCATMTFLQSEKCRRRDFPLDSR